MNAITCMRKLSFTLSSVALLLLASCAAQVVPIMSVSDDQAAKRSEAPSDRAVVYVFREQEFCGQKTLYSVIVDGRTIGWNGSGTYYKLTLLPGIHELKHFGLVTAGVIGGARLTSPHSLTLTVDPGKTYYIRQETCLSGSLAQVIPSEGATQVVSLRLARFDPRNLTTAQIEKKLRDKVPLFEKPMLPKQTALNQRLPEPLRNGPDISSEELKKTLGNFLERVGVVLLVGLAIFGASHNSGNLNQAQVQPMLLDRPGYVQQASPQQAFVPLKNYVSTSGDIYSVSGNTITSTTKGERWTIDGNTIRGANGIMYRISGNSVYSDSGQSYQLSGKTLLGIDGSICSITDTLINCK